MLSYQEFVLRDITKLPISGKFLDPLDNTIYISQEQEGLNDLCIRINQHRLDNGDQIIDMLQLPHLIVVSLYETCSDVDKITFFEQKEVHPSLQQVFSFAKVLTTQWRASPRKLSMKELESRSHTCHYTDPITNTTVHNCVFHKKAGSWTQTTTNVVKTLLGVNDLETYPNEKNLGQCTACGGCSLPGKIPMNVEAILAGLTPEQINNMVTTFGEDKAIDSCFIFRESLKQPNAKDLLIKKLQYVKKDHIITAYARKLVILPSTD